MTTMSASEAYLELGLPGHATEAEIRARYLALVKQFPPERDPERFRRIRTAYDTVKDPLTMARHLASGPSDIYPSWEEVIEAQRARPPRLSVQLVLSLGNRDSNEQPVAENPASPPF